MTKPTISHQTKAKVTTIVNRRTKRTGGLTPSHTPRELANIFRKHSRCG